MQTLTNRSRTLFASILLGASMSGALGHAASAQGLTYEMKMTMQRTGSADAADSPPVMAGRGQYSGGNSRMDMDESMMPLGIMGRGTYVIVRSGAHTELIVDPAKRQYFEINIDSMASFASNAQGALGGLVKMTTSDVTVDMQPLGPGETIQGYATKKYRLTSSATTTVSVLGRTRRSANTTTSDIWVAPQLTGLFNPAPGAGGQMGGNSEGAQKYAAAYAKLGKGVPIKTVSQSREAGDKASPATMTMTMTMELLNIKQGHIDPSVFEVPAGYTKIDVTPIMSALAGKGANGGLLGQMGDSAKEGAKEGAVQEVKSQAKDKAKGVLRGIFGRPE
jgi:uncharacterized protein DUF4412